MGESNQSRSTRTSRSSKLRRVLSELSRKRNTDYLRGMSRFGIRTESAVGLSVPELRKMAKELRPDHELAGDLWKTGIHEARILAGMIDDPQMVTEKQMDEWSRDFDSWDLVDNSCGNLFDKTPFAVRKALEWAGRSEEFVKRAGFAMMAEMAVHDKKADDKTFLDFLPVIVRESSDNRNFVKKSVNWALRQIGKKNSRLNQAAIQTAEEIHKLDAGSAKWIASDALRELTSEAIQKKLKNASKT
jgi:3-methyladenine DNA glycosylase AlkD